MKEKKAGKREKSFEEGLEELEGIVQRLEAGDLSLEDSLAFFEQGVRLTRLCADRLEKAEKRIEILMRDDTGEVRAEPADPGDFEQDRDDADGEGEAG